MGHHKIVATFHNDGSTSLAANILLDSVYFDLFEEARSTLANSPRDLRAGIRLVVFGYFCLEALSNEVLRDLLQKRTQPPAVGTQIWEALKRAPLESKVALLAKYATVPDASIEKDILHDLNRLNQLRNRLAHFKDPDIQISGPISSDELEHVLDPIPDVELVTLLTPPLAEGYANIVLRLRSWLLALQQEHFPVEGIQHGPR